MTQRPEARCRMSPAVTEAPNDVEQSAKIQESSTSRVAARTRRSPRKNARKAAPSSCSRAAAAGGCAFDGAKIALQPITDVAHLVHGPIACEGNSWDNREPNRPARSSTGPASPPTSTKTTLSSAVRSGSTNHQGNHRQIRSAGGLRLSDLRSGDDRRRHQCGLQGGGEKFGKPVIPDQLARLCRAEEPRQQARRRSDSRSCDRHEEPEYTTPYDINIIGEYNLSGEFWQVKPLLDELGIRILACISGDARYHEVARSHRARAAMMVCSKAMINVARKMEERYGIPFFEGSFYGIGDMSDSLAPDRAAAGRTRRAGRSARPHREP